MTEKKDKNKLRRLGKSDSIGEVDSTFYLGFILFFIGLLSFLFNGTDDLLMIFKKILVVCMGSSLILISIYFDEYIKNNNPPLERIYKIKYTLTAMINITALIAIINIIN